ncbi:peptidase S59, nucleoporin, partial [Tanacetum coccineum]
MADRFNKIINYQQCADLDFTTQTSSDLFGVIGQGNNNGVASAPTSMFGVPAGGIGTSTFTFGQPSSLTPTAFGTPFTTGFSLTSSSLSSTPTLFGTPFTGFNQTSSSSSTPTSFGTPSFTGFSQTSSSLSTTPTLFGTPSYTGFNQTTSSSSTPTLFGTPSFTGFSQTSSSLSSTPTLFGTPSFSPFNQTSSSSSSTPTLFGTPSFSPFNPSGTSPAFSSTRTPFGPSSTTGTPSPSYAPTTVDDELLPISGGNQATRSKFSTVKLISISAMPAYDTRSHEELRWDNYMTRKTTAPFNPFAINSSAVKSSSSIFPPFSSSPANNISTTSWPSTTTSPTWNYPAPIAFTSSNTSLTTTPSNSFNPFAINPSVKSTSSGFPPGSSLPVTTSWPSPGTTFPSLTSQPLHVSLSTNTTLTTDPSNSFNPFAPKTSLTSPASTFPFTPLNHTPFQIPSTSLPTQPSFSSFTYPSKASWPTSVDGPFPMVPAATNSVTVSPVSCEPTPTCNQLSLSHITSTSAAASPFGILPPSPQLSFSRSTPIQYGISSIPVKDKPAPVRYPLLTTRHFSRGGKLPIRKYDPKLSGPKIPYYSVTSEMPDTFFVPRENPRALIITREKSQPRENMHEELSGSMYEKERDGISDDTGSEGPTNDLDLFATIVDVPSKLQQPDYYTEPQISELEAKERAEP